MSPPDPTNDDAQQFSLQCVRGKDAKGRDCYAYVVIPRNEKNMFEKMIARGEANFEMFGKLIREGTGEPTEEIRQEVLNEILKDGTAVDDGNS